MNPTATDNRKIGLFSLIMINIIAVDNIRTLPFASQLPANWPPSWPAKCRDFPGFSGRERPSGQCPNVDPNSTQERRLNVDPNSTQRRPKAAPRSAKT